MTLSLQLLVLDHPLTRSIGFLEELRQGNGTFFLYMDWRKVCGESRGENRVFCEENAAVAAGFWLLFLGCFCCWFLAAEKGKRGREFWEFGWREREVLSNEIILFIPPIYSPFPSTQMWQVSLSNPSLYLIPCPITKLHAPPLHEVHVPPSMVREMVAKSTTCGVFIPISTYMGIYILIYSFSYIPTYVPSH